MPNHIRIAKDITNVIKLYTFYMACYDINVTTNTICRRKAGDCMTGKEIVNLIRSLRVEGMSDKKY